MLKLWPLFVKLLGKVSRKKGRRFAHPESWREGISAKQKYLHSDLFHLQALHRSGSFINSLLQLEELGFRSGSPVVKKIAFIAWKSLIDNFALNPGRLKKTNLNCFGSAYTSVKFKTFGLLGGCFEGKVTVLSVILS